MSQWSDPRSPSAQTHCNAWACSLSVLFLWLSSPVWAADEPGGGAKIPCTPLQLDPMRTPVGQVSPISELEDLLGSARVTASIRREDLTGNESWHSTRASPSAPAKAGKASALAPFVLALGTSQGDVITLDSDSKLCQWKLQSSEFNGPSPVQALSLLNDGSILVASGLELFLIPTDSTRPAAPLTYWKTASGESGKNGSVLPAYFTALLPLPSGRILLGAARGLWSMSAPGVGTLEAEECLNLPVSRVRALALYGSGTVVAGSRSRGLVWIDLSGAGTCETLALSKRAPLDSAEIRGKDSAEEGEGKDITALALVPWNETPDGAVAFGTFSGEVGVVAGQGAQPERLLPAEGGASPAIVHRMVFDPETGRLLVARGPHVFAPRLEAEEAAVLPEPLITPALGYDHRQVGTFLLGSRLLLIGAVRVPIPGGHMLSWHWGWGFLIIVMLALGAIAWRRGNGRSSPPPS